MAANNQVLTIKLNVDYNAADIAVEQVTKQLEQLGVVGGKAFLTVDTLTNATIVSMQVAASSTEKLSKAMKELMTNANTFDHIQSIGKVSETDNTVQAAKDLVSKRQAIYSADLKEAEAKMRSSLLIQQAIATEGSNSITAIKVQETEKIRKLYVQQANALKVIDTAFTEGTTAWLTMSSQRNNALRATNEAILRINQSTRETITVTQNLARVEAERTRVSGLSVGQRMGESQPILTQNSQISSDMIRGMTQSSIAAREHIASQLAAAQATNVHEEVQRSFFARIIQGTTIYQAYNSVLNLVTSSLRSIPRVGIELDSTKASLEATVGAGARAEGALAALDKEAQRTGINLVTLRENFRNFQASTSLAGQELENTWHMFTNLNTVITGLHLTSDKANGIFLAMSQIFNKNKVQSEELVKQLGNLLPGAFASFAAATSRTTEQLTNDMKKGLVTAGSGVIGLQGDVEKFTTFMADRFSVSFALAAEGLNANIGRMQNSFIHLGEAIYAQTSGPMVVWTKRLTEVTNYLTDAVNGVNSFGTALEVVATVGLGVIAGKLYMFISALETTAIATKALEAAMLFLSAPALIIAGLTAIGAGIYNLVSGASEAVDAIDRISKASKAAKEERTKADQITFDVESIAEVVTAKSNLAAIQKQLDIVRNENSKSATGKLVGALRGKIVDISTGGNLESRAIEGQEQLNKAREIAQIQIENKLSVVTHKAVEQREKDTFDIEQAGLARRNDLASKEKLELSKYNEANTALRDRQTILINIGKASEEVVRKGSLPNASAKAKEDAVIAQEQVEIGKKSQENLLSITEGGERVIQKVREDFAKAIATKAKQDSSAATSLRKEGYAEETLAAKVQAQANDEQSKKDDELYKHNLMSIKEFFDNKKQYIQDDANSRISGATQNVDIAKASGSQPEIVRTQLALDKLIADSNLKQQVNENARNTALETRKSKIEELYAKEALLEGKNAKSIQQSIDYKYARDIQLFAIEAKAGDAEAIRNLATLNHVKQLEVEAENLKEIKLKAQSSITTLSERELTLNQEVQLGIKTRVQAETEIARLKLDIQNTTVKDLESSLALAKTEQERLNITREITRVKASVGVGAAQEYISKATSSAGSPLGAATTGFLDQQALLDSQETTRKTEAVKATSIPMSGATGTVDSNSAKLASDNKYMKASTLNYMGYFGNLAGMGAATAMSLTQAMVRAHGAQSKEAKQAFLVYKALETAKIIMSTATAAMAGYEAGMKYGGPAGPALGAALAGTAIVMGAVELGLVMSAQMPAAHGGLTEVPEEQTYLLQKGERVLSPNQNKDLNSFMAGNKTQTDTTKAGNNVYNIAVTVQATKDQNPADLGNSISNAIMRGIAKEEIATAARPGNILNKTTSFG
jgi:tape measure domain-containing protein